MQKISIVKIEGRDCMQVDLRYPENLLKVGRAIGYSVKGYQNSSIVLGKSTFRHNYGIEDAIGAGIMTTGVEVIQTGPISQAGIAFLRESMGASLGIMVSVCENSKSKCARICLNGAQKPCIDLFSTHDVETDSVWGKAIRVDDAQGRYIEHLKRHVPKGVRLNGLRVVLDCSNGALYDIAPKVFTELGAEVVPVNVIPDGFNVDALSVFLDNSSLRHKTQELRADVAFAFNGDGNRLLVMNHEGKTLGNYSVSQLLFSLERRELIPYNDPLIAALQLAAICQVNSNPRLLKFSRI